MSLKTIAFCKFFGKLLLLNPRVRHDYLSIQLLWPTAQLLVSCVSPIYLVEDLISLLQVLPEEMRMVGESRILLFFLFLVLIKECGGGAEYTIFYCKSSSEKLLLLPS